jgi:hypothetical protein
MAFLRPFLDPDDLPQHNLLTIFQQRRENHYESAPQPLRLIPFAKAPVGGMRRHIFPKFNTELAQGKKMFFAFPVGRYNGILCEIGEELVRDGGYFFA